MTVVETVISNGVERLAELLRVLDENNILLVNAGSFVHKENIESDSRMEVTIFENALKEKKLDKTGKIDFQGVPIRYVIIIRKDMGDFKQLYIRYMVASEKIEYKTTLPTAYTHNFKVEVKTTNNYAIEVSVRPLYNTALFAFNMNYRLATFIKPNEFLYNLISYRKALVAPEITREGTLLWKIKTQPQEFKQALLSVLKINPDEIRYYR